MMQPEQGSVPLSWEAAKQLSQTPGALSLYLSKLPPLDAGQIDEKIIGKPVRRTGSGMWVYDANRVRGRIAQAMSRTYCDLALAARIDTAMLDAGWTLVRRFGHDRYERTVGEKQHESHR